MAKPSEQMVRVIVMLQRGEVEGQCCPLHQGKRYYHRPSRMTVTLCGPAMRLSGTWTGRVSIKFMDDYKMSVAPSSLEEVPCAA